VEREVKDEERIRAKVYEPRMILNERGGGTVLISEGGCRRGTRLALHFMTFAFTEQKLRERLILVSAPRADKALDRA
jgi:hypothetical protein